MFKAQSCVFSGGIKGIAAQAATADLAASISSCSFLGQATWCVSEFGVSGARIWNIRNNQFTGATGVTALNMGAFGSGDVVFDLIVESNQFALFSVAIAQGELKTGGLVSRDCALPITSQPASMARTSPSTSSLAPAR
jgi:hypothetical protein